MSKREIKLYLDDIKNSIKRIEEYTKSMTFEQFASDPKTIDAVIRNLSVIGEAVNNLPEEIKSKHPNIPWEEIIGMRNKIVHEYFGVDEGILWKTVTENLLPLKERLKKLS